MTIPQDSHLRIVCHFDASLSRTIEKDNRLIEDIIAEENIGLRPIEIDWVEEHGGAENENWLVRLRKIDDPFEIDDGEVFPLLMAA